ncbi:MAG: KUP/HAK/KT family potassium transporter [Solirubrobacteraceae bacterium]
MLRRTVARSVDAAALCDTRRSREAGHELEGTIDVDQISYFLSQMTIVATAAPGMSTWRKRLFLTMAHNAASPARYFGLPDDRTVTIGGASPSERLARSSSCASRAAASGGHPRDRHSGFAVALAHYLRGGGQRRG